MMSCTRFRKLNVYAALRQRMILGKIYCVICIKSTGEQASMVTKPRTLGLLGHSDIRNLDCIFDAPRAE